MEIVIDKRPEACRNKMMSNPMKEAKLLQATFKKTEFYSFLNELNLKTELGDLNLQ